MVLSWVSHRTMVVLEKQDNEAFGFEVQVCCITNVSMALNAGINAKSNLFIIKLRKRI